MDTVSTSPASPLAGDWQEWNAIWSRIAPQRQSVLYTPEPPKTLMQLWQRAYFDDLWALASHAPDARFLELGSGRGTTSMYVASRGREVTLVDLAPAGLELAARNFSAFGLRAPILHLADARDTRLDAERYDCVYNIGLLEHFDDPLPVLREALRLLKPGGLLFMVVIPERSPWCALPVRVTLNPVGTGARLGAAVLRRMAGRLRRGAVARQRRPSGGPDSSTAAPLAAAAGSSQESASADMVRTSFSRGDYVRWLRALGGTDVSCIPYNPYFGAYRTPALEQLITVPAYRAHLALRRRLSRPPFLAAAPRAASCDLLLCRKRPSKGTV
jgi:SAM-dependent methyltransferase